MGTKNEKVLSLKDIKISNLHIKKGFPICFRQSVKASLSVEGSLVLPIFLFFIITLLTSLLMIKEQSIQLESLHQEALNRYIKSVGSNEDYIEIQVSYKIAEVIPQYGIEYKINDCMLLHGFSGYRGEKDESSTYEGDEFVYITETGTKYHLTENCSYLKIRPQMVNAETVSNLRNLSGGKYYPCRLCKPKLSGVLYVTNDGGSFHSAADCPGLKRTIYVISLREALDSGYTACSRCG